MRTRIHNLKRYLAYLPALLSVILFVSCETEIGYPVQGEPQLVMNALLDPAKEENFVYLDISNVHTVSYVERAEVTLYINGQKVETAEESSRVDTTGYNIPGLVTPKRYRLTSRFYPGDHIRIEAETADGKFHTEAETIVPQPIEDFEVDTLRAYIKDKYNQSGYYRKYNITLKDRPGEDNYYRLDIVNDFTIECRNHIIEESAWTLHYRYDNLINREDVILTDGHPTTSDQGNETELFPVFENRYNIFSDARFKDTEATLKVYTPLYEDMNSLFAGMMNYGDENLVSHTICVRILCISEMEYKYLKALSTFLSDEYDNTYMEPVYFPSNVKGGLGFVGACSQTIKKIRLPDNIVYMRYVGNRQY